MFGIIDRYDTIKYIQSKTGYRCPDMDYAEFSATRSAGICMEREFDSLRVKYNGSSPLTMLGEFKYLLSIYAKEDVLALSSIVKACSLFLQEFKEQLPDYCEALLNSRYLSDFMLSSHDEENVEKQLASKAKKGAGQSTGF